jgi:uncharacterized protein (TIGR03435 family)
MSFRIACFFLLSCSLMAAQSFQTAMIKPSTPQTPAKFFTVRGTGTLVTGNTTLSDLVRFAYELNPKQIAGLPEWLDTDKFDIVAEAGGQSRRTSKELEMMAQNLLKDRFKATFHREQKELSVYALTAGPNGPKLTKSAADPAAPPRLAFAGFGKLPAKNATMAEFVHVMQFTVLDRPVVDQTRLTGKFDFDLNWTPDATQFAGLGFHASPGDDPKVLPDLFTAIQTQLGLKLEPAKASVEVLVIDGAEKPTEK